MWEKILSLGHLKATSSTSGIPSNDWIGPHFCEHHYLFINLWPVSRYINVGKVYCSAHDVTAMSVVDSFFILSQNLWFMWSTKVWWSLLVLLSLQETQSRVSRMQNFVIKDCSLANLNCSSFSWTLKCLFAQKVDYFGDLGGRDLAMPSRERRLHIVWACRYWIERDWTLPLNKLPKPWGNKGPSFE